MNPGTKVSVVIPAYNAEKFLERTLRSALRQTHRNLEVLVINDGSTDETLSIAEAIARDDKRIRIITIPNGGVANARNVGIQAASAEFIAFLDADDLWHPSKIELQLEALTGPEGEGVAAVYTLRRTINLNDRATNQGGGLGCTGFMLARLLYAKPIGNGSSLLVRREAALRVGGYNPAWAAQGLGGCEDLDFELRLAAHHRFAAVPLCLVGYRVYPGNMSSNGVRMSRAALATVEHHVKLHPELPALAVRQAMCSTIQYSLQELAREKEWKLHSSYLLRLLRTHLPSGLLYTNKMAMRRLRRKIQERLQDRGMTILRLTGPPHFDELSPARNVTFAGRAPGSREQRIVDQLAVIDAMLEPHALSTVGTQTPFSLAPGHPG